MISLPTWIAAHRGDVARSTFWLVEIALTVPLYLTDCDQSIAYDGHTFVSSPLTVDGIQGDSTVASGNGGRLALAAGGHAWQPVLAAVAGGARAFAVTLWEAWLDTSTLPSAVPPATAVRLVASTLVEAAEWGPEWLALTLGPSASPALGRLPFREYSDSCTYRRFKGPQCGYAGADTVCTRTYADCTAKGNVARFGGFSYSGGSAIYMNAVDEYVALWEWTESEVPYTGTVTFRLRGV